jgi:hypothetical protein
MVSFLFASWPGIAVLEETASLKLAYAGHPRLEIYFCKEDVNARTSGAKTALRARCPGMTI